MDIELASVLLGSALGALGTKGKRFAMPERLAKGTLLGLAIGQGANTGVSHLRRSAFNKQLQEDGSPKMSTRDIKKLRRLANVDGIPVFKQVDGKPLNNAFYTPIDFKPEDLKVFGKFKKIAGAKKEAPKGQIYFGKGFDNLAIGAHELGHAEDFQGGKSPRTSSILQMLGGIGSAASLVAAAYANHAKGARAATLVGLGLLVPSQLTAYAGREVSRANERKASRNALRYIKEYRPKDYEKARELLNKAYGTYDPVRFTDPGIK